jgi:hypothetical protein
MRVIYTSIGMSKSLGSALYIRCALSIEKYGIFSKLSVKKSNFSCTMCSMTYGLPGSALLLVIFPQTSRFSWKKWYMTWSVIFSTFFISNFIYFGKTPERDIITHAFMSSSKRQYVCPILSKIKFPPHFSIEFLSPKFHDHPSSGSRIVPWGEVQKFNADEVRRIYSISSKEI